MSGQFLFYHEKEAIHSWHCENAATMNRQAETSLATSLWWKRPWKQRRNNHLWNGGHFARPDQKRLWNGHQIMLLCSPTPSWVLFSNYRKCLGCFYAMLAWKQCMMTSSWNGSIYRVTGPLCGEFTGPRWILYKKASGAELWYFLIFTRINGWVNNGEADNLRRHRAHYDVTVMVYQMYNTQNIQSGADIIRHDIIRILHTSLQWLSSWGRI